MSLRIFRLGAEACFWQVKSHVTLPNGIETA